MDDQEVVLQPNEPASAQVGQRPRRTKLIVGIALVVVLLAGAAFVGGQLLNKQVQSAGLGGPIIMGSGGLAGDGAMTSAVAVEFESAKELPASPPDVTGLFAERKDNSVFVTVSDGGGFMVAIGEDGKVSTQTNGNGQKLEVVVTKETTLYKDVTDMLLNGDQPADGKIQQKVAPGSIDEIGQNSFVTAWGERRGDRLIAKVLFYSQPMIGKAP